MSLYNYKDRTGIKYGRLTAIRDCGKNKQGNILWECRCDCGNIAVLRSSSLGRSLSCGCLRKEKASAMGKRGKKHGMTGSSEYSSWDAMRYRCRSKKHMHYKRYGGRGIKVCERWNKFENFYADMGPKPTPRHTIERIDNNKDYEPGNCRWATYREQGANQSSNRIMEYNGERMIKEEWCRIACETHGMSPSAFSERLRHGWTLEEALTTPPLLKGPRAKKFQFARRP